MEINDAACCLRAVHSKKTRKVAVEQHNEPVPMIRYERAAKVER